MDTTDKWYLCLVELFIKMTSELYKSLEALKKRICLKEITELDICNKSMLQSYINNTAMLHNTTSTIKIQAIIDYMYEQVNIGNWKEVKPYLRKTITIASYLKLLVHIYNTCDITDNIFEEAFKIIDFGILFGCPINGSPKLLQNCASIIHSMHLSAIDTIEKISSPENKPKTLKTPDYNVTPLEVVSCPSMETFFKNYIQTETPVVISQCMNHWPALENWKDENYFIKLAGLRTVSIELGNKYTDSDWTQKLMTVKDFIQNHIYQSNGPTGYLAQYQLFEHIPELKKDIAEPEYCCFANSDDPVDIMAWFGPKGTVSPLHHDPKRNLLAQVVGEKQIFLFSPKDSDFLYPHEHELLNNTAKVDPRNPDLNMFPKYKDAKAYYCVLSPGQMLYIPPKWWHFVESLSISFSVSFWWE